MTRTTTRTMRGALAALVLLAGLQAAGATGDAERGRSIYLNGRLADGTPVAAERPGSGALPPQAAACVSCHRPSALGGTEGGVLVPPITGAVLWAPGQPPASARRLQRQWLRHQTRGAYDAARFGRALATGQDPDGRALNSAMPRYRLDAQAQADLLAYLHARGAGTPPGLQENALHLASVVTPQAPAPRRQVVETAMARWAEHAAFGSLRVHWHRWVLQGEPATWPAQLQALWQAQPVYALLSGAGGSDWGPVEAWCEAQRVPCLMPVLDRTPPPAARHWSVYLSGGVEAEARMLAQALAPRPGPVLQLHEGPAGAAAALALRQALVARGAAPPAEQPLPAAAPIDRDSALRPEAAARAASGTPDDGVPAAATVVLWLRSAAAQAWLAAHAPQPGQRAMLSAQLAPPQRTAIPPAWQARVAWVSHRADPVRQAAGAALSLQPWAQRLGLADADDAAALADVHAATFFFSDAMALSRGQRDPDYLLERLETAVDRRPAGAAYFRLSLGPGQRIAAQGGHLLALQPPDYRQPAALPGYLRADD